MSRGYWRRLMLSACCLSAFLFLLAVPITPLAPSYHALALSSSSPIAITSQSTSVNFPNLITFNVSARDTSSNIVSAEIIVDLQNNSGPSTNNVPIGAPGRSVNLSYQESTTDQNFIPPGDTVTYFWRFADSAGNLYLEPQQSLTTTDTRFTWQHLDRGLLQVDWYGRPQNFGQVVLNDASQDLGSISANLGGSLESQINLWVYETDTDFHGSLPPGSYEWVGGVAFPMLKEAEIVVADPNDLTLVRDMPHELTHLVFHQLIGLQNSVPTWFDEGLAVFNQQYHEAEMKARFDQALATHSLLRLDSISFGFPANADEAYLAYAQSWNLVQYMYSTFGTSRMIQFIKNIANPAYDFNQAMQAALGVDTPLLENQWRLHLNQPAIPLPPTDITPTPHVTPTTTRQASSAGAGSDNRSWTLILLGAVLVIASLAGFLVLFVTVSRNRRTLAALAPTNGSTSTPQNGNGIAGTGIDPSRYMRDSMYMQPTGASPQPAPQQSPSQQASLSPFAQRPVPPVWPPYPPQPQPQQSPRPPYTSYPPAPQE
jgi:lipopolysaccharide export system protein LptA